MADYFYGLEPRWSGADRLFRVYVLDEAIVGAYVAGQIYDRRSAHQLQALALPLWPSIKKWLGERQGREAHYDTLDPLDQAMLRAHEHNFRIARSKIVRARFRRTRSLWTPSNMGVVAFDLRDGREWKFILVGEQQQDDVLRQVRRCVPKVEVTGRPRGPCTPTEMPPGVARMLYAILGALFVGYGAFLGSRVLAGPALDPGDLLFPLVSSLLGYWSLMTAAKLLD